MDFWTRITVTLTNKTYIRLYAPKVLSLCSPILTMDRALWSSTMHMAAYSVVGRRSNPVLPTVSHCNKRPFSLEGIMIRRSFCATVNEWSLDLTSHETFVLTCLMDQVTSIVSLGGYPWYCLHTMKCTILNCSINWYKIYIYCILVFIIVIICKEVY